MRSFLQIPRGFEHVTHFELASSRSKEMPEICCATHCLPAAARLKRDFSPRSCATNGDNWRNRPQKNKKNGFIPFVPLRYRLGGGEHILQYRGVASNGCERFEGLISTQTQSGTPQRHHSLRDLSCLRLPNSVPLQPYTYVGHGRGTKATR